MIAAFFLTYAGVSLFNSVNALRRPVIPGTRFPPLWLPGMIVSELAATVFLSRLFIGAGFAAVGAVGTPAGLAALAVLTMAQLTLLPQFVRTVQARRQAVGPIPRASGWKGVVWGRPSVPDDIELVTAIRYHGDLTFDLYRARHRSGQAPVLVYVHGGSWRGGDPHTAGRAMFHALARSGWAVATIRYPLSPAATFPDHLIGVKRALAWIRAEGASLGLDPDRIAIGGGSAGGHLAALAALTANRPELQPGFEDADTSVRSCVPMYAIFDFVNRNRARWDWPLIPRDVMKSRPHEDPERYALASPLDQVGPHAPPFLVIHGGNDSLVPPREAHIFVQALREVSTQPVEYLEVVGAQHAFDAITSTRTRAVATRILAFLETTVATARA
ncbi:MAG: alpha/beta hydrolase fold domain-containing protein [Acidimicrobiia bacterium]